MVLIIDNHDSFVYNLARYVGELGFDYQVSRNNQITLNTIKGIKPSHIILSPGPCGPQEAGICVPLIQQFAVQVSILGVCLGHQAIGYAFGAKILRAKQPMHGKSCELHHNEMGILQGLKNPLTVARYHSLIVSEENLPKELLVTARSQEKEIMALQHQQYTVFGVHFNTES